MCCISVFVLCKHYVCMYVWRGCADDAFHFGCVTLEACAAQALPWVGADMVQAPARELWTKSCSSGILASSVR